MATPAPATNLADKIAENPKLYADIAIDAVQKLGLATVVILILLGFLLWYFRYLITSTVETLKTQIKTLNDQNKRYQDYFLSDRKSSGNSYLGEKDEK